MDILAPTTDALPTEDTLQPVVDEGRKYWASETDPDVFVGALRDRRKRYWDTIQESGLWSRIRRNWRYYHGLFAVDSGPSENEIRFLGEQGETMFLAVNHMRNLLQHILTIVTEQLPSTDATATNTDSKSLDQARLANLISEYLFQTRGLSETYKDAVEDSLVFTAGYVGTYWDMSLGKDQQAPPLEGQSPAPWQGDVNWFSPAFQDVFYDSRVRRWPQDVDWVAVRFW